ncbi:hypothetical protein LSG31_12025 [Fodinisporobacter ferrooxydans]|uniref:Uncharacterized protein n=1 Tax=Fodinisporobacter ferrooxydans TaxID=2901836 RepID=A0ABY4CDR4_9BACL|nr:hypothetical protein LSG31_12025 [Alicyclobacillaceae bacterium MYW30-H2]
MKRGSRSSPISSPVQGMHINKILDAIYESSRTGREVFISNPELLLESK